MFTPEEAAGFEPKIVFPDENNRLVGWKVNWLLLRCVCFNN
jgi:hypothetical protein